MKGPRRIQAFAIKSSGDDIPLAALANNMLNVRLDLSLALDYVEWLDRKPTYARTSSMR